MMSVDPRLCSRDSCKPKNINLSSSVKCYICKRNFHLPCYDIHKLTADIFVKPNIVFLCDECLASDVTIPSPKRKVAVEVGASDCKVPSMRSDDSNGSLCPPCSVSISTIDVSDVAIDPIKRLQSSVDLILSKIDSNASVLNKIDAKVTDIDGSRSVLMNAAPVVPSFANVLRKGIKATPKRVTITQSSGSNTSQQQLTSNSQKPNLPGMAGKLSTVIGKPLSPKAPPKKSIWISRLHRDTVESDIATYVNGILGAIPTDNQISIRKLVKKDRELSSYSFVSFRITCTLDLFTALLDADKWPSSVEIREFEVVPRDIGVKLSDILVNNANFNTPSRVPKSLNNSKNVNSSPATLVDSEIKG